MFPFPFSPWLILAAVLAITGAFGEGHHIGFTSGVNQQKVADQSAIDKVNASIAENKRVANADLENAENAVIAIQAERDKIKTQLNQEHQTNVETTNRLHDTYAAYRLRFQSSNAGCGAGGADSMPGKGQAAGDNAAPVCQLSAEASSALRSLAYQADQLRDDYKLLYDWAHQ